MERLKRNERLAALNQILTTSPNRLFTLSFFCEIFGTAKSTLSEDIDILGEIYRRYSLGRLDSVLGAAGGVRFRPYIEHEQAVEFIKELCQELQDPSRLLAGGFLYLSDILSAPDIVQKMAIIIAGQYYDLAPDFVLTMETKGIPVALMTAQTFGVPLVIARRSSKVYEGSAVNINYVSGTSGRIETMSLSRRAVKGNQRCLIVDDFIKAGATAKGMIELMKEFDVTVIGTAFVMATANNGNRLIEGEKALMIMDVNEDNKLSIRPADWLSS